MLISNLQATMWVHERSWRISRLKHFREFKATFSVQLDRRQSSVISQCMLLCPILISQELLNELVTQSGAISVGHLGHDASVVAVKRAVRNNSPTQDSGEGHHEDNPRTPASIRRFSSDNHRKTVNRSYRLDSCFISRGRMPLRSFVGPYRQTAPRYDTVVWSLIVLVIFFLSLCLAARFPTQSVRVVFVSISGFVFLILLVLASTDLMDQGRSKRR